MTEHQEKKKFTKHASPTADGSTRPELLYDRNVARPSHAEDARTLTEKMDVATLCTISEKSEGHPYGSFVTYAMHENLKVAAAKCGEVAAAGAAGVSRLHFHDVTQI